MTSTEHFRLLGGLRAESCSRVAVWAGGATIASVLLISFDVLARKFLGFTTGGADELSSYAFAISTSWALAFATLQRANVRVDVLPIPAGAAVGRAGLAVAGGAGRLHGVPDLYAYDMVQTSWAQKSAANTPLATPLWIPQGLWLWAWPDVPDGGADAGARLGRAGHGRHRTGQADLRRALGAGRGR